MRLESLEVLWRGWKEEAVGGRKSVRSVGGGLWKQIVREGRRLWEGGRRSEDVEVREEVGVRR